VIVEAVSIVVDGSIPDRPAGLIVATVTLLIRNLNCPKVALTFPVNSNAAVLVDVLRSTVPP
jgi:hypothetical protein